MNLTYYFITSLLSIVLGQVVAHLCKKLPPVVSEEISYSSFLSSLTKDFKFDIKYSIIFLILFNFVQYAIGLTLDTYIYCFLIAILAIVFSIDYRFQLIPDEAHIAIALLGILHLIFNTNQWLSYLLGALVGGGIFWSLGLLALLIFKKEGMGFGDVKLMAALGFLFGLKNILVITLVAFVLGAVVGLALILLKQKKSDSYIPFGPFIVIATVILIFVQADSIIYIYISFCTWLGRGMTDIIYNLIN